MSTKLIAIGIVVVLAVAGGSAAIILMNQKSGGSEYSLLDESLQVFGNANGDWKVDSNDVSYLDDIIKGDKVETKYADANQDGKIDEKDKEQVQALIDNTAENVWIVDGDSHIKKVGRNITKIGCEYYSNTELMLILGQKDKVYAVDYAPYQAKSFYFGSTSTVADLGNMNSPDYEAVGAMDLDILLTFSYSGAEAKQEKLPDVDVVYLGMYRPNVLEPTKSEYFQGILKAGYIFGAVEKAENYMKWLLDIRDMINDKTSGLSEDSKPKVLMTNYTSSYLQTGVETTQWSVYTSIDPMGQACLLAGGHMVAKDILTEEQYNGGPTRELYGAKVGMEAIMDADIDFAFCHCVKYTFGGADMGKPDHGYAVNDHTEMDEAYTIADGRMDPDKVDIDNIYIIAGDFRNGASGCMLLSLYMAKALHPTIFTDLDPLEYHQQYVADWMGISGFDIHTNGVFISPGVSA